MPVVHSSLSGFTDAEPELPWRKLGETGPDLARGSGLRGGHRARPSVYAGQTHLVLRMHRVKNRDRVAVEQAQDFAAPSGHARSVGDSGNSEQERGCAAPDDRALVKESNHRRAPDV